VQLYWDVLAPYSILPADRSRPIMAGIFLLFFAYNLMRWRLARAAQQAQRSGHSDQGKRPTRPTPVEYDPTFDFSKPDITDKEPKDSSG
jgi:hypothetical protein